jgi:uncharacterized protein involved in cysteine biosynthesis
MNTVISTMLIMPITALILLIIGLILWHFGEAPKDDYEDNIEQVKKWMRGED